MAYRKLSIFWELKKWIFLLSNCLEGGDGGVGTFSKRSAVATIQVSTLFYIISTTVLEYSSKIMQDVKLRKYQGIRTQVLIGEYKI